MTDRHAIVFNNVSKKYKLFSSPKDRLLEALHPFRRKYSRDFWALQDVSFEVSRGTTLGIIGKNGSGKSTLLQLVCSVLTPTSGSVMVQGRVSALLELGAGFNPEFNGRENVIFQGLSMGFSKAEMQERLPWIESFADIGSFFEQPVKTYSTGMFVRLAFASAISVDPDILVVDEALAVGDASFQNKCYRQFKEIQDQGKTIIFVTHDLHSLTRITSRAILLVDGKIFCDGPSNEVVHIYHEMILTGKTSEKPDRNADISTLEAQEKSLQLEPELGDLESFLKDNNPSDICSQRASYNKNEFRFGDGRGKIIDYLLVQDGSVDPSCLVSNSLVEIYIRVVFRDKVSIPLYGIALKSMDGILVFGTNTRFSNQNVKQASTGQIIIFKFTVSLNLPTGHFFIDLGVGECLPYQDAPIDIRESAIHVVVENPQRFDGLVQLDSKLEHIRTLGTI